MEKCIHASARFESTIAEDIALEVSDDELSLRAHMRKQDDLHGLAKCSLCVLYLLLHMILRLLLWPYINY